MVKGREEKAPLEEFLEGTPSLSDIMEGKGAPFWVDGRMFYIRPPTTEEYDQALLIQDLTRASTLQRPEVQAVKDLPISDGERQILEAQITIAERAFEAAEDRRVKDLIAERLAFLRRQLETRTRADELADRYAILKRDRWLTFRLLCDEDGKPVFDPDDPAAWEKWERFPMKVKDEARPAIWEVLTAVRNAPFD
ncbi:MAG: hypothetical protein Kow0047_15890 [Anaerolineae bacterium]